MLAAERHGFREVRRHGSGKFDASAWWTSRWVRRRGVRRRQSFPLRLRTAARWPGGMALTAWSYFWRTTPVHRWEMTGSLSEDAAPDLPADVDRDDVQETGDGAGPLVHRIYRTRIVGGELGPDDLVDRIAADLDAIAPSEFATFQKLGGDGPLAVGDEYIVRMPGPWHGPVRVVGRWPGGFRLATLTGHLEAGLIEFRARTYRRGLEFTIESWARSGDWLSDLMYSHLRLAKEVQLHMWTSVLERVIKLARGRMDGGVVITTRRVEASGRGVDGVAATVSRRARRRLAELSQRSVNFDASRIADYTSSTGWHLDDLVQPLPHEAPGPPEQDGTWELARRLMVDYQLANPGTVRAVYDPAAPLEGRDMLLQIRFLSVRFAVGVRVSEVYENERVVGGPAHTCPAGPIRRWTAISSRARCITKCGNGSTRAMSSSACTLSPRRRTQVQGCCEPASGCSAARTSCASTARSAGESAD